MPTLGTAIAPKTKLTHTCFAFEFYAAVAPRNRIVHTVTVPIILWTFVVGLAKIPIVVLFEVFPFNVSFTVTFLYILYYLLLEPVAGVHTLFIILLNHLGAFFIFSSSLTLLGYFCSIPLDTDLLGQFICFTDMSSLATCCLLPSGMLVIPAFRVCRAREEFTRLSTQHPEGIPA